MYYIKKKFLWQIKWNYSACVGPVILSLFIFIISHFECVSTCIIYLYNSTWYVLKRKDNNSSIVYQHILAFRPKQCGFFLNGWWLLMANIKHFSLIDHFPPSYSKIIFIFKFNFVFSCCSFLFLYITTPSVRNIYFYAYHRSLNVGVVQISVGCVVTLFLTFHLFLSFMLRTLTLSTVSLY